MSNREDYQSPREGDRFTDTMTYYRHEMLYCHAMLSARGVINLRDGERLTVSERLDLLLRRWDEQETERMLKNEDGADRR